MKENLKKLAIDRLVNEKEEHQILVVGFILENHTQQKKSLAQETQIQVGDWFFAQDFEKDK